ncbi:MAG: single-stranded DNA-binding protein [Flavobacteriales bacterium]|nr:single-stranded DNA-binding protein [Flavobacteriales bacterium]
MNGIRNSVRLIGNLGAAPELKDLDKGTKMARVNIATTDYYTDKKGEKQKETQWHTLVAWGKTAELMIELTDKGTEIAVEGKLVNRSYEKDGEKKYITEVVVQEFAVLGKRAAVAEEQP